ncbi:SGNH/GDSL hydrolase family protein [Rugamonas sp.]|uniref:SGNH/GDSL hydrolase family protein n=1 Tax=Rugamonas sp. TaxID=1926287 RepID=UPI0025EA042C|nr:SGNH/GDSL hydrolase family protein [Rugamonas sp.]
MDKFTINTPVPAAFDNVDIGLLKPRTAAFTAVNMVAGDGSSVPILSGMRKRVVGANICNFTNLTPGTDFSATTRAQFTPRDNVANPQLVFESGSASATVAGGEKQQVSPVIYSATLEYPLGQPVVRFSVAGATSWVSRPGASQVLTDDLGITLKAGISAAIRVFVRVPKAPGAQSITAVAAGALAAATTFYYVQTTVDLGVESGPSSEYSGTTGASGTLALAHSWTAPVYGDTVRIYRSATSGGTKQLLAEVSAKLQSYIDYGFDAVNTTINPPAAQLTLKAKIDGLLSGNSTTTQYLSGPGTDVTGVPGQINNVVGPLGGFVPGADLIVAGGTVAPTFGGEHDSIGAGVGIQTSGNFVGSLSASYGNWFVSALIARGLGFYNYSISGSQRNWFNDGTHVVRGRAEKRKFADRVVSNQGTNDAGAGRTWPQIAADTLLWAAAVAACGTLATPTTLIPRPSSTDCFTTAGNQTPWALDLVRKSYNAWLRNGAQVDATGAPVLAGGAPSPYISGYYDLANSLEVDVNNVPTRDGGYFRAPVAPRYAGLVLTGSPSATALSFSTAPFTVPSNSDRGVAVHAIKVTSGAAIGQTAIISCGTPNTTSSVTLYASGSTTLTGVALRGLTVLPSAGDMVDVYEVFTPEGIHPAYLGHQAASADFQLYLASIGA